MRYVLKDYPLSSECNANVLGGGPHPSACEAAVAVRLARVHNREEQMIDWLFANQPQLTPPVVREAAHDIGQVSDFDAKYASTLELVKGDIAFGHTLGVKSTPTFFINGVKIEGALPPQYFEQAIAYELAHANYERTEVTRCTNGQRSVMPAARSASEQRSHLDLTKDYAVGFWRKRPYRALDRLSLEVSAGEVFGFLGPNGAGKTTTLKLLMQLVYPTSGRAEILGRPARRSLRQAPHRLPAGEPVLLRPSHRRGAARLLRGALRLRAGRAARARAARLLDEVGIGAERRLQLRKFSKGMLQRVGIAQALINDPELVDPRRADVGARSARPPRRPRADSAAARSRLHGVLQLARVERRRSALQPRGDSGARPARGERTA